MKLGKTALIENLVDAIRKNGWSDRQIRVMVESLWRDPHSLRTSGFELAGGTDAEMAWDDATRTFTIQPLNFGEPGGNIMFAFYSWKHKLKYHKRYQPETIELPNEEGLFAIYYDQNEESLTQELAYVKNPTYAQTAEIYLTRVIVAWVYWNYENQTAIYFGDSRHGSEWNPQMHWMLHQTINSQRQSGLALTNVTYDGDGTSNGDYQFGISAGELWHDDIFAETEDVAVGDGLPVWYFDAAGQPRFINATGKKFLNTGTGRVAHQSLTGGLAEAPDMHFVAYHLFATNCTLHPHISVTGQAAHETLGAAVGSIEAEVATLRQELPHANLMHIGSFVLQTSDEYTNSAKAIIVYTSATEDVFVTDTDFNTDTGILTLFRSANRPPLEQPLDIGKLVVEAINNYPETITNIVNNIATTIVQNGIASMKESYLVDPVNDTSFTQLSSWFVEAPNELMGDFRAVVVVRDKTTHAIVTLQNTLGFDYTDAANEVEDDSAIITDGSITLVLSVDATTNKLKAVLSGMTANAKRIHFCFERCANNTQPPLTLPHLTGEGTPHDPTLEGEVGLTLDHLEGEGTVHEVTADAYTEINYGLLYNWYAATDVRKISSSDDWDIPNLSDIISLLNSIDTYDSDTNTYPTAGSKLKEIGIIYWESPNSDATNELNFNARGIGGRDADGSFFGIKLFLPIIGYDNMGSSLYTEFIISASGTAMWFNNEVVGAGFAIRFVRTATESELILEDGTYCTSYRGNNGFYYKTVKIGNKIWLASNLAETEYRNGDPIPTVEDNATWAGLTTGAKCAYENNYSYV